jgi:RNA polymerase sigma-70 factor (ECF subfamily)
MGTMRLALPWEAKIPLQPSEQEVRLGRPEFTQRSASPAADLSPMAMDDAALAAGCQSGNLQAFERLYRLHASRMKSVARNLLGNAVEAEDAVQDTFLKIQRSIAGFRGQSSFATWTFRILINTCYDARRSRMRKREVAHDTPGDTPTRPEPRAASAHPTLRIALERALSQLTRHQRDVFLLYEVEGFRHSEIASILEISEAASKNTLFQAKKTLRQMLEAPRSSAAEAR